MNQQFKDKMFSSIENSIEGLEKVFTGSSLKGGSKNQLRLRNIIKRLENLEFDLLRIGEIRDKIEDKENNGS
jgi:hypothetical protein